MIEQIIKQLIYSPNFWGVIIVLVFGICFFLYLYVKTRKQERDGYFN